MDKIFPAPWQLKGKGYILLYKFSEAFVNQFANVPDFLTGKFAGGFGSVMLVDYETSNAGPYGELLFIPGKFNHLGQKLDTISKIYVSSQASVDNGRRNWGIPKQQADFLFEKLDAQRDHIQINLGETIIADFIINSGGPAFPVNTQFMPFPLVQLQDEQYFYTKFSGSGKGRLAKMEQIHIDAASFPDISQCKPIAVIKVDPFQITFPEAVIKPI
jgi:hypothetical protein